ncbi:MAG TPA: hypothetical protein VF892_20580 [Pseudonocardiaceae bacterium]
MTTPDHVAILRQAGAPPDVARSDPDNICVVHGVPVVLGRSEDPVLQTEHSFLAFAPDSVLSDPAWVGAALDRCADEHGWAATALIRAPAETLVRAPWPALRFLRYVRKRVDRIQAEPPTPADGVRVEPVSAATRADVLLMLLASCRMTAEAAAVDIDVAALRSYLADQFADLGAEGGARSYVAVDEDRGVLGHVTWHAEQDVELVDIDAVDHRLLRGLTEPLLRACVTGVPGDRHVIGNVVGGDDQADAVFRRLVERGWAPTETYWLVRVP